MAPKPEIIPVSNTDMLATSQGLLTVLWTIREYGPLNYAKLFELLYAGDKSSQNLSSDSRSINFGLMNRLVIDALRRLAEATLITIEGGKLQSLIEAQTDYKGMAEARKVLIFDIAPEFRHIQEIFGFSLSHLASAKNSDIMVSPAFSSPHNHKPDDWTDVFVIMPFSEELKPVYDKHLLPVVRNLGLSCKRGDDFYSNDTIIDDVWTAIYYSKLIICDLTGSNANVFYELGIAHTIGRPTILISQDTRMIPFDVRHRRILPYINTPLEMRHFRDALKKAIETELSLEPANELSDILDKLEGWSETPASDSNLRRRHPSTGPFPIPTPPEPDEE